MARGDLSRKITVDVKGEILELKNTINTMVDQLNAFAGEVTRVAREVGTDGKLGGQAQVPGVVAGALPAALSGEAVPHALRAILMIPAVCLIAAIGFVQLYRLRPNKALAAIVLAAIAIQGYLQYFVVWSKDARVAEAFGAKYLNQAYAIRGASRNGSGIYVVVHDLGVSDPLYLAQPVMFLTERNAHYLAEGNESQIPPGTRVFRISP